VSPHSTPSHPPASVPAEAASVLLTRGRGSPDVYVVRRAEALRFFGGFHAFPGGKVHADDDACLPGATPLDLRRVTVVRELFEETGVLIARHADGSFPHIGPELEQLRRDLLEDRGCFSAFLARAGLAVRREDLDYVGSLTTPPFTTMRFDTAFFVAHLPPGQEPIIWAGELDAGRWVSAEDLLIGWARGECLVSPPTLALLEAVRGRAIDELPTRVAPLFAELERGAIHPIWFSPGVQMIPLRTIALAPSTHTNAFLVGTGPR
jgi:ribonuclease/clavin/mitogillin